MSRGPGSSHLRTQLAESLFGDPPAKRTPAIERLKRPAWLATGAGCGIPAMVLTYAAMQPAAIPLELDAVSRVHDAGLVAQGSVTAAFELRNRTREPVQIAHVVQTCRCATTAIDKKELAPGESARLSVRWNTTGLRGASSSGIQVYYVIGDQNGLKTVALNVRADVEPEFDYAPASLRFRAEDETVLL